MAMIKCSECDKDISDTAVVYLGCGAPIAIAATDVPPQVTSSVIGDLNSDGKVDFEDFKIALSRSKQFAADQVDAAVKFGKEKLQSAKEKDAAAVEKMTQEFGNAPLPEQSESLINRNKFKAALESTIDVKFADIMRSKKEAEAFLTYVDAQTMTAFAKFANCPDADFLKGYGHRWEGGHDILVDVPKTLVKDGWLRPHPIDAFQQVGHIVLTDLPTKAGIPIPGLSGSSSLGEWLVEAGIPKGYLSIHWADGAFGLGSHPSRYSNREGLRSRLVQQVTQCCL